MFVKLTLFENTVKAILAGVGERAFRPFGRALNAAVLDAVMYGVASRLAAGPIADPGALRPPFEALLKNTDFMAAVTKATADEDSVRKRLEATRLAFASVS